jgi:two-component sensor histidine kinase
MWAVAVTIGWAAINWLVVRPLGRLQRGVDRYAAGDASVRLGGAFVSHEMEQFGTAFDRLADQIDAHEGELRDALATQKKLTREVLHRVKNNLQIVSSLLSLQSRDATSPEVAYAYATIQKRVNALALVHRWLFDDEAMRGVDMKSLTHDLCAGLEQSVAQAEGANISITADVERIFVGQDTAVPLAFLITEFVTAAARLGDKAPQALRVSARAEGERAALTFEAPPFRGRDPFAQGSGDPAARIVQGMTRQMRSKLVHDAARGRYSIDFPVAKG